MYASRASEPVRLSPGQLVALDCLAALGFFALLPALTGAGDTKLSGWVAALLVAAASLPVAVRRQWPVPVFCLVLAMTVASLLLGVSRDPFLAAAYALYPVALTAPRPRWEGVRVIGLLSLGLVVAVTTLGVATPRQPAPPDPGAAGVALLGVAVLGGTWTVGRAVRERRAYAARAATEHADRAVTAERLRIARDLHDIVAHGMSLIAVKAGVANHVLATRPEEAQDALRVIEQTSRSALTELRHLLGVLRSDTDPPGTDPAPGIGDLPGLADRAAMAGVRVELDCSGTEGLPEGVGVSVYRIAQEAVTNVVKHAAPARCWVTIAATGGEVTIEVVDDGAGTRRPPPAAEGGRHGLVGMRERVAVYGGRFSAGPRPGGGFAVTAHLPLGATGLAR